MELPRHRSYRRRTCSPLWRTLRRRIMLDMAKADFSDRKYVVPGPSASGGMISLEAIESLLAEHAQRLGVDLKRGVEVTNFTQDDNGVMVNAGGESFAGRWLVGCDGGRSTVRKIAGFEFAGKSSSRNSLATPQR